MILDPKFSADEGWLPAPDMTPREFLEHVVKPNIADLRANPGSSRHAHNAVLTSDALAGHIYFWLHRQLSVLPGFKDDDIGYRNDLASRHLAYRILRDLAAALKHVALMRRGKEGRLIPGSSAPLVRWRHVQAFSILQCSIPTFSTPVIWWWFTPMMTRFRVLSGTSLQRG